MHRIAGILLAGGRATRCGGDKLLRPLTDGTPLGVAAARRLRAVLAWTIVVVRPDDRRLAARLVADGMQVVACEKADLGMAASLAGGVEASRDADGWVIALADMPFIAPETIQRVVARLQSGALLAAPCYRGRRGHPVGVAQPLRAELLGLSGDRGARDVLARHASCLRLDPVDDPGILVDIDTPADVAACLS